MKNIIVGITILVGLGIGMYAFSYFQFGKKNIPTLKSDSAPAKTSAKVKGYEIKKVVGNLRVPWSIVFTGNNRMLVSERHGDIRVIQNETLAAKPLLSIKEVVSDSEDGLMSMTIHPDYERNDYLYVSYTYKKGSATFVKVVRFVDLRTKLVFDKIIFDNIPAAQFHAGTRIKFGPDKKLYVTTGDATTKENAQKESSLSGKVWRMQDDGSERELFATGFRNSQGLDWDPVSGVLWATDHGPSGFDGPPGGDEVNRVTQGGNYGWPVVSHEKSAEGMIDPQIVFTPAIAPSGMSFYRGDKLPDYKNNLFFSGLKGEGLFRATLTDNRERVEGWEKLSYVDVGRVREVVESPDGYIYFTTSNRDGRGSARSGDDAIYKIVPVK